MSVTVREAEPDDVPVLLALWVEAWTAFMPTIDFAARLPWFTDYLAGLRRDGAALLVAVDEADRPIGFATVDAGRGEMAQLVTALAAQRRGVGRRLLGAAKLRSPGGLGLSVLQGNAPALALYRDEGFVVTAEGVSERSGLPTFHMQWRPVADAAAAPGGHARLTALSAGERGFTEEIEPV